LIFLRIIVEDLVCSLDILLGTFWGRMSEFRRKGFFESPWKCENILKMDSRQMPAGMTAFEKDGFLPTVGSRPATGDVSIKVIV